YTMPKTNPNILTDYCGYESTEEKRAVIVSDYIPDSFAVVDRETGDIVYEGRIILKTSSSGTGFGGKSKDEGKVSAKSVGYADLSDFTTPGTYYIKCEKIGLSFDFEIKEELYLELLNEALEETYGKCESGEASFDEIVMLFTAYEWYPECFTDEDENSVPDMLDVMYKYMATMENGDSSESDSVYKAAILAQFGYLYQNYDKNYATSCLKLAGAYFAQSQTTSHQDAESFYALTQLYRASGKYSYREQLKNYGDFFVNNSTYLEKDYYLYGAMAYMTTRQKVDVNICKVLMDDIKARGEEVSSHHEDMISPVTAKNSGPSEILKRARDMIFANFVLPSYQYNRTLEEIMHYLGGINPDAKCYYDEEDHSDYILLLIQLANVVKPQE
ncbi:MAG: glycoside hydrolase family 9 protein, partial [Lachnospiraceae bacterium]|nr:glycoside hydrolase family 9 protein [Lachnospiraceae bacterium]